MKRFFGPPRRAARRNKHWVWTAVLADDTAFAAVTVTPLVIVTGADWSALTAGNDEATFVRCRGWFQIRWDLAPGILHAYIGVFDKDEPTPSPKAILSYTEEDILWTSGSIAFSNAAGAGDVVSRFIEVDVRVKRKLRASQEIRLVIEGNVAGEVSGVLRGLMQLAG